MLLEGEAGVFDCVRVQREEDLPTPDPRVIDVAVLDMNHGWPNVGHDAIVLGIQTIASHAGDALRDAGLRVRAVSYDVRRSGLIPPAPAADDEGGVYVGTGGPGHLDPRCNDGMSEGSQTIVEDPSWEAPLFDWFDAVRAHPRAALIGVCHTFGVMCRWLGVATPSLRGPEKGGKSAGVLDNLLTPAADAHPWFHRLIQESPAGPRIRILDNRLYDLLPTAALAEGRAGLSDLAVLSTETLGPGGPAGDGLTMIEVARDAAGIMPRIFGVNHHPEIMNRERVLLVLWQMRAREEVSHQWYEERAAALTQTLKDAESDRRLDLTSRYTLFEPLRFHLYRQIRLRAERAGRATPIHEDRVLDSPTHHL